MKLLKKLVDALSTFVSAIIRRFKRTPANEDTNKEETSVPNESPTNDETTSDDECIVNEDEIIDNEYSESKDEPDKIEELHKTISELKNMISEAYDRIHIIETKFEQRISEVQNNANYSSLNLHNWINTELNKVYDVIRNDDKPSQPQQTGSCANSNFNEPIQNANPNPTVNKWTADFGSPSSTTGWCGGFRHPFANQTNSFGDMFAETPVDKYEFPTPNDDDKRILDRVKKYDIESDATSFSKGCEIIHDISNKNYEPQPIKNDETYRIIFNKYEDYSTAMYETRTYNGDIRWHFNPGENSYTVQRFPVYLFEGTWDEVSRLTELLHIVWFYTIVDSKGNFICSWENLNINVA